MCDDGVSHDVMCVEFREKETECGEKRREVSGLTNRPVEQYEDADHETSTFPFPWCDTFDEVE